MIYYTFHFDKLQMLSLITPHSHIFDVSEGESSVRFNGVKIHTYGPDAKPLCKPTIHLPGFIKIAEGTDFIFLFIN